MARSKNVTATGRPARKLFLTANDPPESQKGLMFQAVLEAMADFGVRDKKNIPWAMILASSAEPFREMHDYHVVAKYRSKPIGSSKYKNYYVNLMVSSLAFTTLYKASARGKIFDTLHSAANFAETYYILPKNKWSMTLTASDIPQGI